MTRVFSLCVATSVGLFASSSASAAGREGAAKKARDEVYRIWDVDRMIGQAARNVARRYNLNAEQTKFTEQMMQERVMKFLSEHEEEIWPLVRDLAKAQITGKPATGPAAQRLGQAAMPIIAKAKEAILEANHEWGEILSDEQKRLHDYDLRELDNQFAEIRQNFKELQSGKPVENPIFPTNKPKANEPPRPPQPAPFRAGTPRSETRWERYVRDFIRRYELDAGQAKSAESILRETLADAERYRASKASEFEEVEKRLSEAIAGGDLKQRASASRDEKALNKRIADMFQRLKARLDKIPTPAQKQKYQDSVRSRSKRARRTARPPARTSPKPAPSGDSQDKGR